MAKRMDLKIHAPGEGLLSTIRSIAAEVVWAVKDAYPESRIQIVTKDPEGSLGTVVAVSKGSADIGMSFPLAAQWAVEDRFQVSQAEFHGKMKNLRALASLALFSWYPFAVRVETGITSIEEIKKRRYPLRLVTTPGIDKANYSGAVVRQILDAYGIPVETLKEWGGKIMGRSYSEREALKEGHADAVHCELPQYEPWMFDVAAGCDLRFLPVSDSILKHLHDVYGHPRAVIPKRFYRGVQEDTPVVGRFNLLLFVRPEMPEEVSYALAKLMREVVSPRLPKHIPGGYLATHTPDYVCTGTGIPLHSGAETYYREVGLEPTLEVPSDPDYWRSRFAAIGGL